MQINLVSRIGVPFGYQEKEMLITEGRGVYIYDQHGKKYLDLCSGLWNMPFGYKNEIIEQGIKAQMDKLPYSNLIDRISDIQLHYAERILSYTVDYASVYYTCSGSESIEAAMKSCRKYQVSKGRKEKKIISAFDLSYHGTTYGAMSISGIDRIFASDYDPIHKNIRWIKTPEDKNDISAWIREIEEHFNQYGNTLSGVFAEPVIASGGVIEIPETALRRLQDLCMETDTVFVLDEVATGFGRLGVPFAYQLLNLKPDLICLSKAVNNGYLPLGLLLYSDRLALYFAENNLNLEHFSTQGGNLLAVAAADAMLDIMASYNSFNVAVKGTLFKNILLESHLEEMGLQIRGYGMMIAIEFPKTTMVDSLLNIIKSLRKGGFLVYFFNNPGINIGLSLFPPYILLEEEIIKAAERIIKVIKMNVHKLSVNH